MAIYFFLAVYLLGPVEWFYCIHSYLPNRNASTTKSQLMAKKDIKYLPLFKESLAFWKLVD